MRTDRRDRRALLTLVALVVLSACEPEEVVPFVPPFDSGRERADTGPVRPPSDAGRDTGLDDGGELDGGDGGEGTSTPVIDGVIGELEWEGAQVATSSTTPGAPFTSDRLERVLAMRTEDRLYVAIEGRLGLDHALLLLLDEDYGAAEGLLLTGPLTDVIGALDRAISAPFWTSPLPDFRPEYAWGTTRMPIARTAADADSGWREIASAGELTWLGSGTVSVCTVDQCETSIALAGGPEIALAVRIGRSDGVLSNQTLPMDVPTMPETISQVMRIPAP